MFGRISLKDPSQSFFDSERMSGRSFSSVQNQALRARFFENDQYSCYIEGTLVYSKLTQDLESLAEMATSIFAMGARRWLETVDGIFFVYAFDKRNKVHLLLNNRYQLTHLFYVQEGDDLLFSNQLRNLLDRMKSKEIHFPSVINFLRNGFNQSDQTQIKGVKKLLPTFWIEVSSKGFVIDNHWRENFLISRKSFTDLEQKIDQYESIYQKSLESYLEARQPEELGALLSGGHDTSFLVIQASKIFKKRPIQCFTVTFPDWNFSEHTYAKSIAEKWGGDYHPFPFQSSHLRDLPDLIEACEEPVLGSTLPLHCLAKHISQTTDTLLGGDGGDTLWGEYFPVAEFHRWIHRLPLAFRKGLHQLSLALRNTTDWERFWELEHVASLFAVEDFYTNFMGRLCTYRHFSDADLNDLLIPDLCKTPAEPSALQIDFNANNFSDALIEGKFFNAFLTYQSFQQTRSINSHGVEFYLPTIQKDVAQFINSLPNEWLNGGSPFHRLINSKTINRRFHKHALQRYLKREEIYNRSFDIPWHQLLSKEPNLLYELEESLVSRGWYRDETIHRLFREFRQQKNKSYELLELKSHGYRIMALLALETWCQKFSD